MVRDSDHGVTRASPAHSSIERTRRHVMCARQPVPSPWNTGAARSAGVPERDAWPRTPWRPKAGVDRGPTSPRALTPGEISVLRLIAAGNANKQIADQAPTQSEPPFKAAQFVVLALSSALLSLRLSSSIASRSVWPDRPIRARTGNIQDQHDIKVDFPAY